MGKSFCHRRLARVAAATTLLVAGGCAAAPGAERHTTIVDANRNVYRATDNGVTIEFRAPRAAAWRALFAAYGDVGLPPEIADSSSGVVARLRIPMRRVYHGVRTSVLFSCGETAAGGSQADNGQVVASASSQVTVIDSQVTRVSTIVDAYVIPDGGTSSNTLHCGSTGDLETRLHKAIGARLGIAPGGD